MYGSWDIFCHFGPLFALLSPYSNEKSKFWENEKIPGDIIILHMRTKNDNHMMYGSWDIEHDGQNFFLSFWTIFCTFTPLTTQRVKILKKWKHHLEIYHFTQVYHKWQSWCFLRYGAWRTEFFVILERFLPFPPPKNPKNKTFQKMKKIPGGIITLHTSVPKIMIICYTVPEIWCITDVSVIFHFGLFFALFFF